MAALPGPLSPADRGSHPPVLPHGMGRARRGKGQTGASCCPTAGPVAPPALPRPPAGPGLLLLGSVMRTLAHTVSEGWHCFGVQWLELVVSVQSWHHRP